MIKKLLFVTDLPVALFAAKIANLLSDGLEAVEIFPGISSEPSKSNFCIVAYAYEMPKEELDFVLKNIAKNTTIFLSHETATCLGSETMKKIPSFIIRDTPFQVVMETIKMIELLSRM